MEIYTSYHDRINTLKNHHTGLYSYYKESKWKSKSGSGLYSYRFKTEDHYLLNVDYTSGFYKLVFCFDGYSESFVGNQKKYSFEKGRALLYTTFPATYSSKLETNTRFNVVHLHLSHTMVKELQTLFPDLLREEVIEIPLPPQSYSLLQLDKNTPQQSPQLRELFLEKTIYEQVYGFFETVIGRQNSAEIPERSDAKKIAEILELIEHSPRYITINELSREAGINSFKLKSLFRKELNKSVFEYQVERKLSKAYRLLLETRRSISEISLLSGYQSTGSFSNAFKRKYGIRPSDLRNS